MNVIKGIEGGDQLYYMHKMSRDDIDIFIYGDVELVDVLDQINFTIAGTSNPKGSRYVVYQSHLHHLNIRNSGTTYKIHTK